jgi:hypothetical protein
MTEFVDYYQAETGVVPSKELISLFEAIAQEGCVS